MSDAERKDGASEPVCPLCRGIGFVYARVPAGHPDFGRARPCRCSREESIKGRQQGLLRYSNLGTLARITFEEIKPEGISNKEPDKELFHRAFDAARAFAREPNGWLIFTGPSGSGKSHLAAAIANECLKNGCPAFYITTPDLLEKLRSSFIPEREIAFDEFFSRVREAPLLVLDDLGIQPSTPWATEKLDQLINYRFASELPTVIVAITPIDNMDDRIRTRLSDPNLCRIYALQDTSATLEYGWAPEFRLQSEMTFDNFNWRRVNLPLEERQNLEGIYNTALSFAKSPDGWLVLAGVNGCGKTHLAAAIANYRYSQKKPVLFIVVPEFLDHLRATFSPESTVSYDQFFERVKRTPLLILDDFGEQSTTPWAQEKLYQVINYRYNARLPTVITTSKSLDEIEDRVSSRLTDAKFSMVWNIMVPDYRSDRLGAKNAAADGRKRHWRSQ